MTGFGERLRLAVADRGALCVGIDPHEGLLREWGLDATAAGTREFGLRVVDAAAGRVAVVKPQVAFFERFGSAGFAALEDVLAAARAAGLIAIADAKRGDIGTTMDGYAAAWLSPGAPLEADAVTVSPYLGVGALVPTFDLAERHGKGVFVLAATSNPEALDLQRAVVARDEAHGGPQTVAHDVVREASAYSRARTAPGEWASVGFVIGATVDRSATGLPDALTPPAPILAPGFGAQGAALSDLAGIFGGSAPHVLASASRSILRAGPEGLEAAIDAHNRELKASTHA
ncbi:orotidine-5'-phosphate decarboxylase [Microbacterium sp.]|uniref:orotidine-5'-phosphate decarboxylase n=1 Tax=Microbacterium sp. TaxID=51671 RepID=UPI0032214350